MYRGTALNISLLTGLVKDLRETETFAPAQLDLRNIRLTDAGNAFKRRGYTKTEITNENEPIIGLIPENDGYIITEIGSIYTFTGGFSKNIYTSAPWHSLPTWSVYDNKIIVAYGGFPLLIDGNNVAPLGGNPVLAKFVETISSFTILSGHHETEFWWSASGNPENYTIADGAGSSNVQKTGTIQNMVEYKDRLLFFKEREIEVWNFVGGTAPFRRYAGGKIFQGLGAKNSVVKANDNVYWFGHEGDFYVYENGVARVITDKMRRRIDEMNHPEHMIGFDIRKENLIMWINATDGITLLYDYSKNQWMEDGQWQGSGWQALPFKSYMEMAGEQYFGSRGCEGLVFKWSEDYKSDNAIPSTNAIPIRVYRRLKLKPSPNGNRVRVNRMIVRRQGNSATSDVTDPKVDIRWRFDGGDWSNSQHLTLGAVGKNDPYVEIRRLGIGRELEVEIEEMDAVDFLLTDMILNLEELTK